MAITSNEFQKITEIVDGSVQRAIDPVNERLARVEDALNSYVQINDRLLQIVQRHDQEWLILRKQHERIKSLLVGKGIAREEDLTVS